MSGKKSGRSQDGADWFVDGAHLFLEGFLLLFPNFSILDTLLLQALQTRESGGGGGG